MSSILLTQRAKCASQIAFAESIRSSKIAVDPVDTEYLKGAKAAMKLLNKRLAAERGQSGDLDVQAISITPVTRYVEMQNAKFRKAHA